MWQSFAVVVVLFMWMERKFIGQTEILEGATITVSSAAIRMAWDSNSTVLSRFIDGRITVHTENARVLTAIITAYGHLELERTSYADSIDQTIGTFAYFLAPRRRSMGKG